MQRIRIRKTPRRPRRRAEQMPLELPVAGFALDFRDVAAVIDHINQILEAA